MTPLVQVVAGPHAQVTGCPFTHEQPSFAVPLQLLSLLGSHVSLLIGPTEPVQAPQSEVLLFAATTHAWVPALHGPLPSLPG